MSTIKYTKAEYLEVLKQEVAESHALLAKARFLLVQTRKAAATNPSLVIPALPLSVFLQRLDALIDEIPENL